jgi:hypothetical protein
MQSGLICAPQQMIAEEPLAAQIGYVRASALAVSAVCDQPRAVPSERYRSDHEPACGHQSVR